MPLYIVSWDLEKASPERRVAVNEQLADLGKSSKVVESTWTIESPADLTSMDLHIQKIFDEDDEYVVATVVSDGVLGRFSLKSN